MTAALRVLQVANEAGPLRLFLLPICRAMAQAGAEVELACAPGGANYAALLSAGFPVHALPAGGRRNPVTLMRIYASIQRLLARRRFDLLVVHTPIVSWIARAAAFGQVPAVVYMAHGLPFAPQQSLPLRAAMRSIERLAGRWTDAVLVMNSVDAAAAERHRLSRRGLHFRVPGVGLDAEAWGTPPSADSLAVVDREFGLAADRPLLLYLGRLIPPKRPSDLLEVARRLGSRADVVLAGEGPLFGSLQLAAAHVGPTVRVKAFTPFARELVHRCAIAVFPSVYPEGLPRFLLEAQAAGKPVVAYDVRGSRDAVDDGATGILVPPGDVNAFYRAVEDLLKDPALRRNLGEAGRRRVREQFSLQRAVDAQLRALAEVLRRVGVPCPWA